MGARIGRRTGIKVEGEIRVKNLENIIEILKQSKASDYSVLATDEFSYELFFVH